MTMMARRTGALEGLVVAVCAALAFGCAPFAQRATAAGSIAILHGPIDQSSLSLWVQTSAPARLRVEVVPEGREAPRLRFEAETRDRDDFAVTLRLAGLDPDTTYRYRLWLNDTPWSDAPGRFVTQPRWPQAGAPPEFAVAVGSCAYHNDAHDLPRTTFGGHNQIFDSIAAKAPAFMLWLGDNVYFRSHEWTSLEGMSARYRATRHAPYLAKLAQATAHVAIWSDHDYGPNDSDGSFVMKGAALEAFKRHWPNPSYGLPGVPGIFTKVSYGDVDFFLLDDRFHRYPNRYPITPDKAMYGPAQMEWLKQALIGSTATFKIVASGGQFWNARNRFESFFNYPAEQRVLRSWLAEQRINGVVFLSGDRHFTELLRVPREGTYPLYEFTSSPLTSAPAPLRDGHEAGNPDLVGGTLVNQRNFGLLRFTGTRQARALTFETYDSNGVLLWQHTVRRAELQ